MKARKRQSGVFLMFAIEIILSGFILGIKLIEIHTYDVYSTYIV